MVDDVGSFLRFTRFSTHHSFSLTFISVKCLGPKKKIREIKIFNLIVKNQFFIRFLSFSPLSLASLDTQTDQLGISKKTSVPWRAVTHHHTLVNFVNFLKFVKLTKIAKLTRIFVNFTKKKTRNTFLEERSFSAERRETIILKLTVQGVFELRGVVLRRY